MICSFVLRPTFWFHFGGVLGTQVEVKAIKVPLHKYIEQVMTKMDTKWSQRVSQDGAKIVQSEVSEAPCFKCGSQGASRPPSSIDVGEVLGQFWGNSQHFCEPVSHDVYARSWTACCKDKPSKSQGFVQTCNIQLPRNRFFEPLFVPSCLEKVSSEPQWAFRPLLVQVQAG